jgi:hypothetical protein
MTYFVFSVLKNVLFFFSERELSGSADPEAQHSQQHVSA